MHVPMWCCLTFVGLVAAVSGLSTPAVTDTTAKGAAPASSGAAEALSGRVSPPMSKAIPFILAPKGLEGFAGSDTDFDPCGLALQCDMRWTREAELKHGRLAMLACVGYVVPELTGAKLPFYPADLWHANPIAALEAVPTDTLWQFVFATGLVEFITYGGKPLLSDDRAPGDFGFDPLAFSASEEKLKLYQMKELKHCRLAMIAIAGMYAQSVETGAGVFGAGTA